MMASTRTPKEASRPGENESWEEACLADRGECEMEGDGPAIGDVDGLCNGRGEAVRAPRGLVRDSSTGGEEVGAKGK